MRVVEIDKRVQTSRAPLELPALNFVPDQIGAKGDFLEVRLFDTR